MGVKSSSTTARGLVHRFLLELEVAGVCLDEVEGAIQAGDHARATTAALNLFYSWLRADRTIAALEGLPGGGASERFARDALLASYQRGAPVAAAVLAWCCRSARQADGSCAVMAAPDPSVSEP